MTLTVPVEGYLHLLSRPCHARARVAYDLLGGLSLATKTDMVFLRKFCHTPHVQIQGVFLSQGNHTLDIRRAAGCDNFSQFLKVHLKPQPAHVDRLALPGQ
jgi:hypothetical protein